jgi:hypothetical protein
MNPGRAGVDGGMDFQDWRSHFERNRLRPLPDLTAAGAGLPTGWADALARSLAVFQLGESRGGRLAVEIDAVPGLDPDYRAAIKLFIAEELRHGQLLAGCVEALGGRLLDATWTESVFVAARRLLGVRFKLVVLLAAEVVGLAWYRTVAARLPPGPLRACLDEICGDEVHHLRFHGDAFRGRRWFRWAWYPVVGAAAAVVLVDHRAARRRLGVPPTEAARRMLEVIGAVARDLRRASPAARGEPARKPAAATRNWAAGTG